MALEYAAITALIPIAAVKALTLTIGTDRRRCAATEAKPSS